MSVRVGLTIAVLVILAVVIAGFIVITIRTNDAMPNTAKSHFSPSYSNQKAPYSTGASSSVSNRPLSPGFSEL